MTPRQPLGGRQPPMPAWTASAVARRLGVAPATLRSWSTRYGIGPADHRAGTYRRYTAPDVAELDTIARLRSQGVPMATAAALARERREQSDRAASGPDEDAYWTDAVTALLHSAGRLDADACTDVLDRGFTAAGLVETWDRLCRPALARTTVFPPAPAGRIADGPTDLTTAMSTTGHPATDHHTTSASDADVACIDAECVLTWSIITSLRRRPRGVPVPAGHRLLLACTAGELHTLALDVLYAALDEAQIPARMLGPSVPAPALLHAAAHTDPPAVFVWAQTNATADPELLTGLARHTGLVVAAGPGWERTNTPRDILRPDSLADAVATAERASNRPSAPGTAALPG